MPVASVNFVLRNHLQQVVAVGRSPPIMIMDDHKSARSRTKVPSQESPMARTPAVPVPRPLLSAPVSTGPVQPLQLQHHLLQHQQHAVYYSDPEATPSPMQAMDDDSVDADTEADAAAAAAYHGSPSSGADACPANSVTLSPARADPTTAGRNMGRGMQSLQARRSCSTTNPCSRSSRCRRYAGVGCATLVRHIRVVCTPDFALFVLFW